MPNPMTSTASPRRVRWRRICLWQAVVLLLGAVAVEVGFRIYLRADGRPFDSSRARSDFLELASRARDFVPRGAPRALSSVPPETTGQQRILSPYTGWEVMASVEQLATECARRDDPTTGHDFEILLVGGSVADVFGALGAQHLEQRLAADPRFAGARIYTYKYARGGFKHPQIVNMVQYLLSLGFSPECVISIDGFNDVALANENASWNSNPVLPSSPHWGVLAANGVADRCAIELAAEAVEALKDVEALARRSVNWHLYESAALSTLAMRRAKGHQEHARAASKAYSDRLGELGGTFVLAGPPFGGLGRPAIELGVKAWVEGTRSLRALCEARDIRYFHVLQPTLHDPGAKPMTDEERSKGLIGETWLTGVQIGYPLMRSAGAELARGGEAFIDATKLFEHDTRTLYYDNCHFGAEGNRILADFVADEILKRWK